MKKILITGLAGSGKSYVAEKLLNLGYQSYDIENINDMFSKVDYKTGEKLNSPKSMADDLETQKNLWICDIDKLKKLIGADNAPLSFYCGTASNIEDVITLFDKVFLLTNTEEIMRRRLSNRENRNYGKTKEAQDWIMTWKEKWEGKLEKRGAIKIDADRDVNLVIEDIISKC